MPETILILQNQARKLRKKITTVGSDDYCDILVDGKKGIHFSLENDSGKVFLLPGMAVVRVNGVKALERMSLFPCDRLEWDRRSAVLVSEATLNFTEDKSSMPLDLSTLKELSENLLKNDDISGSFSKLLRDLVSYSGAEEGCLLSIAPHASGWSCVASTARDLPKGSEQKALFSSSILAAVLKSREPILIENIIGTPHESAYSIVQARIFSVACLPLQIGGTLFGAVILQTHTPGRSIRKDTLSNLQVLATQAAMILASQQTIQKQEREKKELLSQLSNQDSRFVYKSSVMNTCVQRIQKVAKTPLSVLIQGETGTGKEVAALELHRMSDRSTGPFLAINCAAIPASLLESTLFGYEKGAFTGADQSRPGKFEQAHKGTLFLDEVGDLPFELQSKLLRVLQDQVVDRLGSTETRQVDVRILTASHQDLKGAVQKSKFRQDLYYRISGVVLNLPPLRERVEDIYPLVKHFSALISPDKQWHPSAIEKLEAYTWPGNVRELIQVVQRALVFAEGHEVTPEDLQFDAVFREDFSDKSMGLEGDLESAREKFTLEYVEKILEKNQGNRQKSAESLGISERTLYRILSQREE